MPKFLVTKSVDAFANYTAIVEAGTVAEAREIAEEDDDLLDWKFSSVSECDHVDFDNIEPEPVSDDFEIGPSDSDIIKELLAALKFADDIINRSEEELRLIRMKDSATIYDTTLRALGYGLWREKRNAIAEAERR